MRNFKTTLFFLLSIGFAFAQNDSLQHIPNLYLTQNNKLFVKIKIGSPITFYAVDKRGKDYSSEKTVIGYIKKIIDSTTLEVLPISKVSVIREGKKKSSTMCESHLGKAFEKTEILNLTEFNQIKYRSKVREKIGQNIVVAGVISLMASAFTVMGLRPDYEKNREGIDPIYPQGFLLAGMSAIYLSSFVQGNGYYLITPCKDCKRKKKVYGLRVAVH